jgi:hypothetical protein
VIAIQVEDSTVIVNPHMLQWSFTCHTNSSFTSPKPHSFLFFLSLNCVHWINHPFFVSFKEKEAFLILFFLLKILPKINKFI